MMCASLSHFMEAKHQSHIISTFYQPKLPPEHQDMTSEAIIVTSSIVHSFEREETRQPSESEGSAADDHDKVLEQEHGVNRDTRSPSMEAYVRSMAQHDDRCGANDGETANDDDLVIRNKYLDSLQLLKKNKVVIDRLTRKLTLIEQETSSIASELDAIETKLSPMLSQHVASYEMSCTDDPGDDTTATCTATTFSKTASPDRNEACSPGDSPSVHRYINLKDFEGECLLGEMDSVSGLFSSDLSSIHKCSSIENVSVKHDTHDQVEVLLRADEVVDVPNVSNDLLAKSRQDESSYMVSMNPDDLSVVSGLSEIQHQESYEEDIASELPTVASTNISTATFQETGRKSHLFSFPVDDDCCLFGEPSQDLTIPASAEDDDDDSPCFILGIKNRSQEDECGCIIS